MSASTLPTWRDSSSRPTVGGNQVFDLKGRVAVVSGGAGAIGSAIAKGLAEQGASVILASRNEPACERVAASIYADTGREISALAVDVTSEPSVGGLVRAVRENFGNVHILVNAHGYNLKAPALDFPMDEWRKLFDANVAGTMRMCQAFGRGMLEQQYGRIVNVSSVRGVRANSGGNSAYASSKASVDMVTRTLAAEWAPQGVNVNAIAPALIASRLTEAQMREPGRAERYLANIPLGRLGRASDCAGAAVFLASDEADFVTGHILYVDGGLTAVG
ncbi:SDR family NAD(P)-dependent oxidoreductase [Streptomyces sp. NPDC090493]|uniref:SDR family NAD(P)-dependent oxidoreductase n=1 Tax=Streptomyces sp. NPDC090493 TaxID=3365964 RepID=UPI003816E1F8